jgi:hypothetical protein
VVIPEGVTQIDYGAFFNCTALTAITLPSSIQSIGGMAFNGCSALVTVTIPDSVTIIYFSWQLDFQLPFGDCPKLSLASQAALKKRGYTGSF